MEIFGIGPLEIAFILILVIIIFGPNDLVKTGKAIGRSLNKLVRSDTWKTINQTTQELKNLPNRLMREAGLDELEQMNRKGTAPTENTIRPQEGSKPVEAIPPVIIPGPEPPQTPEPAQPQQPDPVKPADKDTAE